MHDEFCNIPGALFLICSYTLREDAVETHWVRCVHAVDAQWQLFARREHAMSAPWPRSQSPVRTPWALLGNATVAVGTPWHLHVMENVKLFAIFCSIFVRSHGALRNFKSPCQRREIAVECDRGFNNKTIFFQLQEGLAVTQFVICLVEVIVSLVMSGFCCAAVCCGAKQNKQVWTVQITVKYIV